MLESLENYCALWIINHIGHFDPLEVLGVATTISHKELEDYVWYVYDRRMSDPNFSSVGFCR